MDPLEVLVAAAGQWRGVNTLQDPHTGRPEESGSTMAVVPILDGRFVRIDYTWGHQGQPQEGSLLVGFDPGSGAVTGHWVDSWHMGRLVLACVGAANPNGTIALRGSFAAPPGPNWGWRIDIAVEPLRIGHTCIAPDGRESPAAEGAYERA